MKLLVTGSAGFVGGYLVGELLGAGHSVIGLDNFDKYGRVERRHDRNSNYCFVEGDAKDTALLKELASDCDQIVALAAKIGGISYFHEAAYDLLAENERISAATFDAAIWAHAHKRLTKVTLISSSMVFENAWQFPTSEEALANIPAPSSSYGFQKLACEYFARAAYDQYGLPFTIVRPFNCAGIGERRARRGKEIQSGNVKLALSHVIPDLVLKVLNGQDPLHIFGSGSQRRCYTYGGDLAQGIRLAVEQPQALLEDFNLSTREVTDVLTLSRSIWERINPGKPFRYVSDEPFRYDVQTRIPSVDKAERLLGFVAITPLSKILDEVIPWIEEEVRLGRF